MARLQSKTVTQIENSIGQTLFKREWTNKTDDFKNSKEHFTNFVLKTFPVILLCLLVYVL